MRHVLYKAGVYGTIPPSCYDTEPKWGIYIIIIILIYGQNCLRSRVCNNSKLFTTLISSNVDVLSVWSSCIGYCGHSTLVDIVYVLLVEDEVASLHLRYVNLVTIQSAI